MSNESKGIPLVKLTASDRHVWFLSSDGEKIDKIRDNQKVYDLANSDIVAYTAGDGIIIDPDTNTISVDPTKYQRINEGSTVQGSTVIDGELNATSTNPVQNRIIFLALANKADINHTHTFEDISNFSELSPVAMSGSYNDLQDKPDNFSWSYDV